MTEECTYCDKQYPNPATLNFHLRLIHGTTVTSKPKSTNKPDARSNGMVRFGKIPDTPDCLSGSFKIFNEPNPQPLPTATSTKPAPIKNTKASVSKPRAGPASKTGRARVSEVITRDENVVQENASPEPLLVSGRQSPSSDSSFVSPTPSPIKKPRTRSPSKASSSWLSLQPSNSIISLRATSQSGSNLEKNLENVSSCDNSMSDAEMEISGIGTARILIPHATSTDDTDSDDTHSIGNYAPSIASTVVSATSSSSGKKRGRKPSNLNANQNKKKYNCSLCGQDEFRNQNHYNNHLEIHEGKRPYLCQQCDLGYETELQLLEHVGVRHSQEGAFDCSKCRRSYKTRRGLKIHKCSQSST